MAQILAQRATPVISDHPIRSTCDVRNDFRRNERKKVKLPFQLWLTAVICKSSRSRHNRRYSRVAFQVSSVQEEASELLPVYSATSLASYLQSDFSTWMDRLAVECPDHPLCAKVSHLQIFECFRRQGLDVENTLLQWIQQEHPEWTLLSLADTRKVSGDWRSAAAQQTLQALEDEVR